MELGERDVHAVLTHLTSVLLGLQMLHQDATSEQQRRIIQNALDSAEALRALAIARLAPVEEPRREHEPRGSRRADAPPAPSRARHWDAPRTHRPRLGPEPNGSGQPRN